MLPAISYMNCVKQFAHAKGLFFFTWGDMKIAIRLYEEYAAHKN
jgi:hypothetical protein